MAFELGSRAGTSKAGTSRAGTPGRFRALVLDEAQQVKNPASARGRAALAMARDTDGLVLAVSGTPRPNTNRELIQLLLITGVLTDAPGATATPRWFTVRFCKNPTPESDAELARFLRASGLIRRTKADVAADLPPKTRTQRWVPLGREARAQYDRIAVEGIERMRDDPGHLLVLMTRLRKTLAEAKAATAVDFAADFMAGTSQGAPGTAGTPAGAGTPRPLVIFAYHRAVQEAITAGLRDRGYPACTLLGAQHDVSDHVARFQAGESPVIVCSYKAAGFGHTLTAASDVLLAEPLFTPGEMWQAEDRCHRIGTARPVTAWYLLAEQTIDRWIYAVAAGKVAGIRAVIDMMPEAAWRMPADYFRRVLREDYGLAA